MDILVKWDKDGSKNVVSSSDLTPIEDGGSIKTGARVKMPWHGKEWWEGTVLDTEEDTDESMQVDSDDDDEPLVHHRKRLQGTKLEGSNDAVVGACGSIISEDSEKMNEDDNPSEATSKGDGTEKGQDQLSFVNSFVNNFTSSEGQALSPHNNNFVTNSVMSSDTFHTPSFGDDDNFEIPPLGQNVGGNDQLNPGFQGGGGNGNNGAMNNPNMQHYNTDYQNMSSPNRNSPRMQMGVTSPPQHPQSPAMTLPSPSHTMSENFNTMANQGQVYSSNPGERSFTDALSHMTESMPNPGVSQHMPVNPHFPPHNLEIPPITQSNNPNMGHMQHHMQPPIMTGTHTFHNMDPYPMQGQPPVTQLSTINQSAISSHLGLQQQHAGMQPPHQGQMPPPQTGMVKQSPSPPQGTSRRSPNQESSEESSDDNTPLAQFAAAQKRVPVIVEQPKEQPITKKKPPKRKRKKDPNEPQKPVSAYALFFRDTQAAIKGSNPNASFGEVSKIVASMWDSLGVEAKQAYKQRTENAKKEYLKKLAAYRASLVSKAGDMLELDAESPSKQKKTSQMTTMVQPPMGINSQQHLIAHRNIAPRPNATSVPITVTMTTASTPMMHQSVMQHMQPVQRVMQGQPMMGPDGMNPSVCRRNGCNKPTIDSPDWDNEYCSNECVVDHCRDVFTAWVATNSANSASSPLLPSVK